jgi:hypothetical protein
MKILTCTVLIFMAAQTYAEQPPEAVVGRLIKVEYFAFGGVGYAGIVSPGEKDFRNVMARSNALELLKQIYQHGNAQARCYALSGIRKLDPDEFERLAHQLRDSNEQVNTFRGCIISQEPLSELIKQIMKTRI